MKPIYLMDGEKNPLKGKIKWFNIFKISPHYAVANGITTELLMSTWHKGMLGAERYGVWEAVLFYNPKHS